MNTSEPREDGQPQEVIETLSSWRISLHLFLSETFLPWQSSSTMCQHILENLWQTRPFFFSHSSSYKELPHLAIAVDWEREGNAVRASAYLLMYLTCTCWFPQQPFPPEGLLLWKPMPWLWWYRTQSMMGSSGYIFTDIRNLVYQGLKGNQEFFSNGE